MKHFPIAAALVLLLATDAHSQEFKTYAYKDTLKLDVFTPPGLQPGKLRPVMVLFHGGGWVRGTRDVMYPECRYFVQRGFVTITASYSLLKQGERDKSICLRDVKSAVRWVLQHAQELHADSTQLVMGGSSAGGHLSSMAALDTSINAIGETPIPIRPKALILLNPAYAATDPVAVAPFDKVNKQSPAVIQFFGSADEWKSGGDKFRAVLDSVGVHNEYWIADGGPHTFYRQQEWAGETMYKMDAFLVSLGILKSPAPKAAGPEKYHH